MIKVNTNYRKLMNYLDNNGVYYPIFLENAGMTDDEVYEKCKKSSLEEVEMWMNTIV